MIEEDQPWLLNWTNLNVAWLKKGCACDIILFCFNNVNFCSSQTFNSHTWGGITLVKIYIIIYSLNKKVDSGTENRHK